MPISFIDKIIYDHVWGFIIVALIALMLLLFFVGVWTRRKNYRVSKISLGVTGITYLVLVISFLVNHYENAAQYYHLLRVLGS